MQLPKVITLSGFINGKCLATKWLFHREKFPLQKGQMLQSFVETEGLYTDFVKDIEWGISPV